MSLPTDISVTELKRMHDANERFILLDVREPDEVATASIAFSKHIPMGQVGARLNELPKDADIVVQCHHGGRSSRIAAYLRGQGYESVANLSGGIDAWSEQIDPSVPVYE